jgi:hypothetical protein
MVWAFSECYILQKGMDCCPYTVVHRRDVKMKVSSTEASPGTTMEVYVRCSGEAPQYLMEMASYPDYLFGGNEHFISIRYEAQPFWT